MVAVFTGNALGLFDTSLTQLGGSLTSDLGRNRQGVNAANGNLVLQGLDELMTFRGLSISATRTYNSLGTIDDVGGDAWVTGFERRVELIGGLNDSASKLRWYAADGSTVDFTYTGTPNRYVSTAGEGAHDTMTWTPSSGSGSDYWIYDEGTTRQREYYAATVNDDPKEARLYQIRNVKSDGVTPTYFLIDYTTIVPLSSGLPEDRVASVRSVDGSGNSADAILFTYDNEARLIAISTREGGAVREQARYGYDSVGRLSYIEHDLTPTIDTDDVWSGTASQNDGKLYRTTYTYVDATSIRIATVSSSDGMLSSYTYDGTGRIKTVTRGDTNINDADGLGETLTFTYQPGRTDVVDSQGRMWSYVYDSEGQLTEQYGPARDGLRDVTYFQYDAAGNVLQSRTLRGATLLEQTDREFDANGNVTWEWDALGNAIQRTYTSANQLATQTAFAGMDPDRNLPTLQPTGGATTQYLYDNQYKLRFVIGPAGETSEIQYATSGNGVGQQRATRTYLGAAYSGSYNVGLLSTWAAGQVGNSTLAEFLYDAKGRLERRFDYASVDPDTGAGEVNDGLAVTRFTYDAQGLLRTQSTVRAGDRLTSVGNTASDSVVDYVYDGIGRLLDIVQRGGNVTFVNGATDAATLDDTTTQVTRTQYADSGMQLRVTQDAGSIRLETRNAAGRVISSVESATGQTSRATQNYYDNAGQLRATQDANGGRSYFFYDERGNVAAEVDATGAMTEYVRDSLGRVVQTLAHAERIDTTSWLSGSTVTVSSVADVRPGWITDFSGAVIPELSPSTIPAAYSAGFRIEGGRLAVQQANYASSTNPTVRSTAVHALSDGAFYSAEITTDASITPTYLLFSLQNNQPGDAYRRVGAYISNGSLYCNVRVGGTTTNTLIGALSANTTYVVEALATEGGIEYRFYAKGQDRDNGFSFRGDAVASEWPEVRLQVNGLMGPGLSGPPIYVDNLRQSLVRRTDRDYDTAGRLIRETDGTAVTTYFYDGASRLLHTVRSAPGETDRVTRYFHDASGRTVGTLDAEGYLVENTYDRAGRLVKTTRYAVAIEPANRAAVTLEDLDAVANVNDQTERLFYDGRGQLIGRLDAEGYLTQHVFDEVGNDRATLSYAKRPEALTGTEDLSVLVDNVKNDGIRQTLRVYNGLGQITQEQNHEGTITKYHYDDEGRLVRTEQAHGTTEVRNGTHWYDAFGQLIGELGGVGSMNGTAPRITETMTDAQKLAEFTAHGVRHSYDVLGRRIESIDAEGNRTWYFYDARGRQTHTVRGVANGATKNALGEVVETRYNAFGQISESLTYSGRIAIGSPYGRAQVQTAITALAFVAAVDSSQQYSYDTRGLLISRINAEGHVSHMRYTGFGQLEETTSFAGTSAQSTTRYQYDLRGLQTGQTEAVGVAGVERSSSQVLDAFGRATSSIDYRGKTTTYAYDRVGRLVEKSLSVQSRVGTEGTSYDAWNRVLSSTNAMGQTTSYAYDDVARSMAVTTEEGVAMTTVRDRFGDAVRITDGAGKHTDFKYDRNGQLVETTNAVDDVQKREYDVRGLLSATVDGNGARIQYTYDAAGRVLTRTEDAGADKLNLITTYAYDGQGRAVTVTDASGKSTTTAYDREGRILTVARDPAGLNLRTQYTWDAAGRQLSVTEGLGTSAARTTAYAYDALGRRTSETVDPGTGRLNLVTAYVYDANGNVVTRTDAAGQVTHYVYNQANRLVFTIDPAGAVTRQWYDEAGRVVAVRRYGNVIGLNAADKSTLTSAIGAGAMSLVAGKLTVDDSKDVVEYRLHDQDGRLRFTIDALGGVNEIRYDSAGRAAQRFAYGTAIGLAPLTAGLLQQGEQTVTIHEALLESVAILLTPLEAAARASQSVFDAIGRERFVVTRIDADKSQITEQRFDDEGRVVETRVYMVPVTGWNFTEATLTAAVATQTDFRTTMHAYDGAGRLTRSTDALGNFEVFGYDAVGNRTSYTDKLHKTWTYVYDAAGRMTEERTPTVFVYRYLTANTFVIVRSELPIVTRMTYDALGNVLTRTENAEAGVANEKRTTEYTYDARGLQVGTKFPDAGRINESSGAMESAGPGRPEVLVTYDALGRAVVQKDVLGKNSYKVYDQVGRLTHDVDAEGYVSAYTYDAHGRQTGLTRYATALNTASISGWTAGTALTSTQVAQGIVATTEDRTLTTSFDARGLKTKVEQSEVCYWTSSGINRTARPTTTFEYDTFGQLVKESVLIEDAVSVDDFIWAETHHYYDVLGRRVMSVDAEGYVTAMEYNAAGQEVIRIEFARAINTASLTTSTPQTQLPATGDLATGYDRAVESGYDTLGRKTSETIQRLFQRADGGSGVRDVETRYEFDAEGRQTAVVVDGVRTETTYDDLGRASSVIESERLVLAGSWASQLTAASTDLGNSGIYVAVSPYTEMYYDAFGNTVGVTRFVNGKAGTLEVVPDGEKDQSTYTRYDWQGRAVATRDAEENVTYSAFDAADRVIHTWSNLTDGHNNPSVVHGNFTYDNLGRQTSSVTSRVIAGESHFDGRESARYNAFGEIVRKGTDLASLDAGGGYVVHSYDRAGNQVYTNADLGDRTYRYNLAGQQVGEVRQWFNPTPVNVVTVQRLDRLGRLVAVVNPSHTLDSGVTNTLTRRLDRWGNVLEEIDPRGNVTNWVYNDRNQAIRQFAPRVLVVSSAGTESWQRPETRWMYDASGRLIAIRDANGHVDRNEYDASGRLIRSIDALGNATRFGYDAVGLGLVQQDALGYITTRTYDRIGRVTEQGDYRTESDGIVRTASARETYTLNQRGDRVRVANGLGQVQRYEFDSRGQVVRSETAAGVVMTYEYDARGNKLSETNELGATQSWAYDIHGRAISHEDLGGNEFTYGNLANGLRNAETATIGIESLNRKISYYPNGQIRRIDLSAASSPNSDYTEYEYDAAGNRTSEYTVNTARGIDMLTRAVYDSHNRLSRVTTDDLAPDPDKRILDLEYAYDAVGNRRRVIAHSGYGPDVIALPMSNEAPVENSTIPDVTLKHGQARTWRWAPGDYFSDPDGTALSYTATLDPAGALPSWIKYSLDAATGEWVFTYEGNGTPGQVANIRVTASDGSASKYQVFKAEVVTNTAPVEIELEALELLHKTSNPLSIEFHAADIFRDSDFGDILELSIAEGFPSWLNVEVLGSTLRLSAAAGAVPAAVHTLTLLARDSSGAIADKTLILRAVAAAGPIGTTIPQQVAEAGKSFVFDPPLSSVFTDPNGDAFGVTATLSDGSPLPAWLSYAVVTENGTKKLRFIGDVPASAVHNQIYAVRLRATDTDGMSGTVNFEIRISDPPPNVKPVYTEGSIPNRTIAARAPWTYTLPADAFTDANGDTLVYDAYLLVPGEPDIEPGEPSGPGYSMAVPLPSWLSFDSSTRTFHGTPPAMLDIEIMVSAQDPGGLAESTVFRLWSEEGAPTYHDKLVGQQAREGDAVSMALPGGAFTDPNGDTLTYTGQVRIGAAWQPLGALGLSINGSTGAITGTLNSAPQGVYEIRITASDGSAEDEGTFTLTVNRRPTAPSNSSASATVEVPFTKTVPGFSDPESGTLVYSATLSTGGALPSWLSVNTSNGTLSGTPPLGTTGLAVLVRATDPAGLWATTTVSINVVNPPPVYVAGTIPAAISTSGGNAWSYQFPAGAFTNDPANEGVTFTARLDSGAALPGWLTFNAGTRTFSGTPPVNSVTVIDLLATDSAGGVASTRFTLTGTNSSPVYNGGLVARTHNEGQSASWTLPGGTFTDANNQTLTYTGHVYVGTSWLALSTLGLSINGNTGAITGTLNGASQSSYQVRITASDGSASTTGTFALTVNRRPVVPGATTITVNANQSISNSLAFSDPESLTLTHSASGLPSGASLSSAGLLTSAAGLAAGSYTFSVTATDPGGATTTASFTLVVQNNAPVVATPVTNKTTPRGQAWSLNVASTFTDPNGDTLTWSASGLPAGIAFNATTKVLSGTPTTAGASTITLTADDGKGGVTNTTFTLTRTEDPPVYNNNLTAKSAKEGDTVNLTLPGGAFTDPNGDTLTYTGQIYIGSTWQSLGSLGLSINSSTGAVTGTINTAPQGSYQIRITASDGSASANGTFTLTVNRRPTAPSNTSASATVEVPFTKTVPGFSDPESGTLVYSATLSGGGALPSWLSVNTSNGTLSGTPPLGTTGLAVLVRATDPAGLWATTTVSINVVNPPPQYVAGTIPAAISTLGGNAWSYQFPAGAFTNDPANEGVTFTARLDSGAALPGWLTFNAGTRTFSGTPPVNSVTVIDLLATDTSGGIATTRFTVTGTNNAPVYNGNLTTRDIALGRPVNVALPANAFTDPNNQTLTYEAEVLRPGYFIHHPGDAEPTEYPEAWFSLAYVGLSINASTGAITGTGDTLTLGTGVESRFFQIRITASDGSLSAQGMFDVNVRRPPAPPASTTITVNANTAISQQITFTDLDGGALTYTATGLPSGVSLSSSGLLTSTGKVAGSYTFSVTATDSTLFATTASFTLVVQNNAPVVATPITNKTTPRGQAWSLNVASTFTDPNGDTLTWSASGLPAGITFNATTKVLSGTPTTAGTSTITLTADDGKGGVTNTTFTLTRTEEPPVYNNNLTAKSAKEGDTVNLTLPGGAFTDPNGDTLTYTGQIYIGSTWQSLGSLGLSINSSTGAVTGTINTAPQGSYQIRITASDGSASANGTFTLTVNRRPTAPSNTSASATVEVPFTKTVPGFSDPESGTLVYSATLSAGGALPSWLSVNTSNGTLSGTPPLGTTGLAVLVRATDPAGLWATTTVSINVVNPPPVYVAGTIPAAISTSGGNAWSYQFPAGAFTNDPANEGVTFTARLDSGAALPGWLTFNAGTRTFSGTPPVNSVTVIDLLATDTSGGVASTRFTLTGTNSAPVRNASLPARSITNGQNANWTIPANTFTDPNNQTLTYSAQVIRPGYWAGQPEPTWYPPVGLALSQVGLSINASTGTLTGTPDSLTLGGGGGETWGYEIQIFASDGSLSANGLFMVTVHRPPVPPASTAITVNANQSFSRGTGFTDPDGSALTYTATGLPSGVTLNASTGVLTSNGKPIGTYNFSITARDPGGAETTASYTLSAVNNAPVVASAVGNQSTMRDQSWSLNVSSAFTDPNGDTLTWSASGLPAGLSFNTSTKVISGTPTAAGTFTVTLGANDGNGGTASTSFTLTVNAPAANLPPIVSNPISDQWEWYATNWSFTVPSNTFSDPNGHTLTYSASGMPAGMTFHAPTRTFSFYTPSVSVGASYQLTVTANDGNGGTVSDSFWLYVEAYEIGGGQMMEGSGLMAAMEQAAEMAASTDAFMEASFIAPEAVEPQSMMSGITPGVNRQVAWFTYDAENRVQIVNGTLDEASGQIVTSLPSASQNSYEVQYDAAGREVAQIYTTVSGHMVHRVDYTQRGERWRTYTQKDAGDVVPTSINTYDDAGRLTQTVSLFGPGVVAHYFDEEMRHVVNLEGAIASVIDYVYDADGRMVSQTTLGRKAALPPSGTSGDQYRQTEARWLKDLETGGGDWLPPEEYVYDPDNHSLSVLDQVIYGDGSTDPDGYNDAGMVTSYRYIKSGTAWRPWSTFDTQDMEEFTHTYKFTYEARDGYLEKMVTGESSNSVFKASTTASQYDAAGRRYEILDTTPVKGQPSIQSKREFAYNADGQILTRKDSYLDGSTWKQGRDEGGSPLQNINRDLISDDDWKNNLTKAQRESWYDKRDNQRMTYVNGQLVASQNEAGKLDVTGQLTGFSNTSMGRTQVQLAQGDTLKSVAQRIYGNENLWYVLADANGLDGDDALVAGSTLTAPEVKTSTNDAKTFKPYNPSEVTGPTTPSLPYIPPPEAACNPIAGIIGAIVGAIVIVYTGNVYAAAAASNTTSQAVNAMMNGQFDWGRFFSRTANPLGGNLQDNIRVAFNPIENGMPDTFSRNQVVAAVAVAYVTQGVDTWASKATQAWNATTSAVATRALQAAAGYATSYGVMKAGGSHESFSWKAMAAQVVSQSASSAMFGKWDINAKFGSEVADIAGGMVEGVVSMHTRRALGFDDPVNYGQVFADAFGNALAGTLNRNLRVNQATQFDWALPQDGSSEKYFGLKAYVERHANAWPSMLPLAAASAALNPFGLSEIVSRASARMSARSESTLVVGTAFTARRRETPEASNVGDAASSVSGSGYGFRFLNEAQIAEVLAFRDRAYEGHSTGRLGASDLGAALNASNSAAYAIGLDGARARLDGLDMDFSLTTGDRYAAAFEIPARVVMELQSVGIDWSASGFESLRSVVSDFIDDRMLFDPSRPTRVVVDSFGDAGFALRRLMNFDDKTEISSTYSLNPVEGQSSIGSGGYAIDSKEFLAAYDLVGQVVQAREFGSVLTNRIAMNTYAQIGTGDGLEDRSIDGLGGRAKWTQSAPGMSKFDRIDGLLSAAQFVADVGLDAQEDFITIDVFARKNDPTQRYFQLRVFDYNIHVNDYIKSLPKTSDYRYVEILRTGR